MVYLERGRPADAEPLLKRFVAITEKAYGPDHPTLSDALNNLAEVYTENLTQMAQAEPLLKRALAIDETALGPDHPSVGNRLGNLGALYLAQGRLADAEPLMRRAVAIAEHTPGPENPELGRSLNNLALLQDDLGHPELVEPLLKRALAIEIRVLGRNHPQVATDEGNLGLFYLSIDRAIEAEPLLLDALAVNERTFAADSAQIAVSLAELGDLYRQLGQCEMADKYLGRARKLGTSSFVEIPVLFATNRKRDRALTKLSFTSVRDSELSFGRVAVVVPTDEARTQWLAFAREAARTTNAGDWVVPVKSVQRMVLSCAAVVQKPEFLDAANMTTATAVGQGQALVYVHGFNNSFEDALRRAGQVGYDLHFDGPIIAFSWPSKNSVLDYFADTNSSREAGSALKELIALITKNTGVKKIHFIAHSMGNVVLLDALRQLVKDDPSAANVIGEVIDASPDVDAKEMAASVAALKPGGPRFTVYASSNDRALLLSNVVHFFSDGASTARAGFVGTTPLIVPGVDTLDVTNTGLYFSANHNLYASNPTLVADMRRLIGSSTRPPDKRSPDFEPVTIKEGTYWRLRAPPSNP